MNTYTVEFKYAGTLIEATDSDMAVIKASAALDLSDEDRGELRKMVLHGETDTVLLDRDADDLDARWEAQKPVELPARREAGLTLTYSDGDLFVTSFGYSASLTCAWDECELTHNRGIHEPKQLSKKQRDVVDEWMRYEDEYYVQNGWKTWGEINS